MAPSKRPRSIESQFLSPLFPALRAVSELLKKSRKQGMVIGGVASSLLGQPRLTVDIDVTVIVDDEDVDQFLIQAATEGLSPRGPHSTEFMRRSAMLLLRHDATGVPIDINQGRLPFELLAAKRATIKRHGGVEISMPTPEDLIVMKAVAHRSKDLEDIRGIVESQAKLDVGYIQRSVQEFGRALDMPELWTDISGMFRPSKSRPKSTSRRKATSSHKKK